MEELEIIPHGQAEGIRIFVNRVEYRSPHFHPDWELLWVLDTPLSITSSQKQHLILPGELILFPPNYPHEFHKMERSCTFLCVQISSRLFPSTASLHTEDMRLANYLPAEEDRRLRQVIIDTAQAYWEQKPFSELYATGQCALVLHTLLKYVPSHVMTAEETASAEQRNARLLRLMQFVDENYMHKIRLADFAAQEGKSVSYMSRFVRDTMNQTFQDYVTSVRFNCARKLIASGGMNMVSVCMESGFSDYRYFSRTFQEIYGVTPAEYSQQANLALPENRIPARSLHSREHIYGSAQSLQALRQFREQLEQNF